MSSRYHQYAELADYTILVMGELVGISFQGKEGVTVITKLFREFRRDLNLSLASKTKGGKSGFKIGRRELLFIQNNQLQDGLRLRKKGKGKKFRFK